MKREREMSTRRARRTARIEARKHKTRRWRLTRGPSPEVLEMFGRRRRSSNPLAGLLGW